MRYSLGLVSAIATPIRLSTGFFLYNEGIYPGVTVINVALARTGEKLY